MKRYNIDNTTKVKNKTIYKIIKFPDIPYSTEDQWIITQQNDRLDLLANQYYNDPTLWFIISRANPILKKNSIIVEPGIQLRIPGSIDQILLDYNTINQ